MNLRPYQEKAISDLQNAVRNGSKAPLLVMPTGSGKTVVFSQIARNCLKKEKRSLFKVSYLLSLRAIHFKLLALFVKQGDILHHGKKTKKFC